MGGLPQDEMVDALLQEFHALRIDHLSKTGLWVDLMKLVREGLSICKAENASRSTSFEIFEYVKTGALRVTIQELNGCQRVINANAETSVQDLKTLIEQKNGPARKRQRLVYQEAVLRNVEQFRFVKARNMSAFQEHASSSEPAYPKQPGNTFL